MTFASCGKEIEDGPVSDPNNPSVSDQTPDNTPDTPTNPDTPDQPGVDNTVDNTVQEWKYDFPQDFLYINGLHYIWEQLDENTRIALGEMMNAIANVEIYCSLSQGIPADKKEEFLTLLTNCTMGYTYDANKFKTHTDDATGMIVGVSLSYNLDYSSVTYAQDARDMTAAVRNRVEEIVSAMPDGTEFEKLKYLYETLILNCTYSENAVSPFTAYGALVEGKATCQGYADAMHLLLDAAGFDTVFATGIGEAENVTHKWNYVLLSDGNWYVIDSTWGDPEGKDDIKYINYDYLLISDEILLTDHKQKFESNYYSTPLADSMDMNYHVQMGYYAETYEQAKDILLKQATQCGKDGSKYMYIRFANKEAYDEACDKLFSGDYEMQGILIDANKAADSDIVTTSWTKLLRDGPMTITVTLKYE